MAVTYYLPAVLDGDTITPQLLNRIQAGDTGLVTTDGSGDYTVTYPEPFAETPVVMGTRLTTANTQKDVHVTTRGKTSCTFRFTSNDTVQTNQTNVQVHWMAFGVVAP